jgi:tetratricopeptide (TPR) repeat protein
VGYLGYYFAWLLLSYLIRQPWLLVGLLALWLLRGVVPPPGALFGALSRAGRLREQVRVNRANITARRDLATIYLDLLRPRRALPLLEEGLALAPDDAELAYLLGLALHRAGRHDEALPRLLSALERDHRLRHGLPYLAAGDVLLALERWDDAADAFERYLDFNSSDVTAHVQLARAYAGQGDAASARKWLLGGLEAWHGLPGALKRRRLGAYLKAEWARVTVLKQPLAIVVAAALGGGLALGVVVAYPAVVDLFQSSQGRMIEKALAASKACGSQRSGAFAGTYEIETALPHRSDLTLVIAADRIQVGNMEYCLSRVLESTPQLLHAEAIASYGNFGEDAFATDELAASYLYDVRLDRGRESTKLRLARLSHPLAATSLTLHRTE